MLDGINNLVQFFTVHVALTSVGVPQCIENSYGPILALYTNTAAKKEVCSGGGSPYLTLERGTSQFCDSVFFTIHTSIHRSGQTASKYMYMPVKHDGLR